MKHNAVDQHVPLSLQSNSAARNQSTTLATSSETDRGGKNRLGARPPIPRAHTGTRNLLDWKKFVAGNILALRDQVHRLERWSCRRD